MKISILLVFTSLLLSLDSIIIKDNPFLKLGKKEVDATKIKIDLNKGIDLNFVTMDPDTGRISDFFIGDSKIKEIKQKSKDFIPKELSVKDIAIIETTKGTIKVKLFDHIAPNHVLNFKKLCNSEFYDRTSFHRVIKDFIIQGGDILSRDSNRENFFVHKGKHSFFNS